MLPNELHESWLRYKEAEIDYHNALVLWIDRQEGDYNELQNKQGRMSYLFDVHQQESDILAGNYCACLPFDDVCRWCQRQERIMKYRREYEE